MSKAVGFSLHAGVAAGAHDRKKLERLCRYIARPAIATSRLSLTSQGQVRSTLKTPYRDGTAHVVFAPHSCWRAEVTPAGRHRALTWAQRLKRVFGVGIETCEQCGGQVKVIASIEDPAVIRKILGHRALRELPAGLRPPSRGPPVGQLESP